MKNNTFLSQIKSPTLLLDRAQVERNIDAMVGRARRSGVRFRPHFKTHQSAVIGDWFRRRGVSAITVSSVAMASYFADHGWEDITIAFPANIRQIEAINALAARTQLGLLVEAEETARFLAERLTAPVSVWLKIDVGYRRTGLAWDDEAGITAVAHTVQDAAKLRLAGLLTHAGHTYHARGREEVSAIYREMVERLSAARAHLARHGMSLLLSIGDTPSCSLVEDLSGVDEMRPGNFVFYDLMQWQIGACAPEQIAVAVACPIAAVHPEREQIVVHGGAIHFSKERMQGEGGRVEYGRVVPLTADGWGRMTPDAYLASLSQEHGVIQAGAALCRQARPGDLLAVLPVHSCLTAHLLHRYLTLGGEEIGMMPLP